MTDGLLVTLQKIVLKYKLTNSREWVNYFRTFK